MTKLLILQINDDDSVVVHGSFDIAPGFRALTPTFQGPEDPGEKRAYKKRKKNSAAEEAKALGISLQSVYNKRCYAKKKLKHTKHWKEQAGATRPDIH